MDKERIFKYLDSLRDTGLVNMFGAGEYLENDFELTKKEAREILAEWMRTFSQRHPPQK